jgi:hypothetical protein
MTAPVKATLYAFNVGFGDCFLLRFTYPDGSKRHTLIDFGSTRAPVWVGPGQTREHMADVAERIRTLCGGDGATLDVLVATHRHKDHISGFATAKNGKGSGDVIAGLKPSLVLQPWTEDPDTPVNAIEPHAGAKAFTASLASMNGFAASLQGFAEGMSQATQKAMNINDDEREFLKFAGENNVANRNAVENLVRMGKASKALFLKADDKVDVSAELPGVKVHVLGPPTLAQNKRVNEQAAKNAAEYWHLLEEDVPIRAEADSKPLFPNQVSDRTPFYARWSIEKMANMRKDMLFSITTALDEAMNNTSLILVFEIGRKVLLFPGDAQWENWQYALSRPEYAKLLTSVDLYKVGHHGSLNATPKSLWNLFAHTHKEGPKRKGLISVMSTRSGIHGKSEGTAVPRASLVNSLRQSSDLRSTEDIGKEKFFETIEIEL